MDNVLVVESQTAQHAEQEVGLQLLFGLLSRVEERKVMESQREPREK